VGVVRAGRRADDEQAEHETREQTCRKTPSHVVPPISNFAISIPEGSDRS
jgi:hypothetical protein